MSEFDNEVKKALNENGSFDAARGEKVAKQPVKTFGARLRKVERIAGIYLLVLAAVLVFSIVRFQHATTTKDQILYLGIFILALSTQVLIKLWYWVMNTKLSVLYEIKQLRLAIPVDKESESLLGDADAYRADLVLTPPKWVRRAWLIAVFVVALGVAFLSMPGQVFSPRPDFAGNQFDEWHISGAGDISVHSRINLTRWPENPSAMVIALPYDNAKLESVTYSGTEFEIQDGRVVSEPYSDRALSFKQVRQAKYELQFPQKFFNPLNTTIDVVWSLPLKTLEVGKEEQDPKWGPYRVRLRGLIPVRSFTLKVILEPDSDFEMLNGMTHTENIPYTGNFPDGVYKTNHGSCSLCIQKKQTNK